MFIKCSKHKHISYLKQQRCKHDSTIPELRYLEALGSISATVEAQGNRSSLYYFCPEESEFLFFGGGELGYLFFDIELQKVFVCFGD